MKTRIRELRKSKKLTQTALAMDLGCEQNTLSRIERDLTSPSLELLCRIADYFNTSLDYILYRSDQRYSVKNKDSLTNSRVEEYMFKLQTLPQERQDTIFVLVDDLIDSTSK